MLKHELRIIIIKIIITYNINNNNNKTIIKIKKKSRKTKPKLNKRNFISFSIFVNIIFIIILKWYLLTLLSNLKKNIREIKPENLSICKPFFFFFLRNYLIKKGKNNFKVNLK